MKLPVRELRNKDYRRSLEKIQGKYPDSQTEVNVAQALDNLGYEYIFQYWLGGRTRGSKEIDFLVLTVPKPTPLLVHGEYWHTGLMAVEDELKEAEINSQMRGLWNKVEIIWDYEAETVEEAQSRLQQILW